MCLHTYILAHTFLLLFCVSNNKASTKLLVVFVAALRLTVMKFVNTLLPASKNVDEFVVGLLFAFPFLVPLEVTACGASAGIPVHLVSAGTLSCEFPHPIPQYQLGNEGCL